MCNFVVWPSIFVVVIHVDIAPFVRNEVSSLLKVTATTAISQQKFRLVFANLDVWRL
jgi:hypothetical protein